MHEWPETSESLMLRVKDPSDAVAWSTLLDIYRPVVLRMAASRGMQATDAEDLAQGVFISIARNVENWEVGEGLPPFRVWLCRIARNAIVNAITRRRPDTAAGSTSVQQLLAEVPERDAGVTEELLQDSRREAFRWAASEIKHEFKPATWSMFWQTSVDGRPIAEVAKELGRTTGAVYLARCRVMQRLKEKTGEISQIWSDVK